MGGYLSELVSLRIQFARIAYQAERGLLTDEEASAELDRINMRVEEIRGEHRAVDYGLEIVRGIESVGPGVRVAAAIVCASLLWKVLSW